MKRLSLFSAVLVVGLSIALGQNQREIHKTLSLPLDGSLMVDTYKGSVEVQTWNKPQAEVHVRIEADEWDRYSEEKVRDTRIEFEESSRSVRIKTDYRDIKDRWSWNNGNSGSLPFVHYSIKMPATASLKIKDYKSHVSVRDLNASADLYTYKGTVDVMNISGPIELETYKGECKVQYAKVGESSFETYKGTIDLLVPDGQGFDLDAKLGRRGDLDSDFELTGTRRGRSRSEMDYRGEVKGGGPTVKLRTYKGNYSLRMK